MPAYEKNTPDEIITVVTAFQNGQEIQAYNLQVSSGEWTAAPAPCWDFRHYRYRVAINADKINWSHVNEKYKYMARDPGHNFAFLYEQKPHWLNGRYWTSPGSIIPANIFASYKQGNVECSHSLVCRLDE